MKRHGFSLLEVSLALAILAGAIAVLGEASRLSLRNAAMAHDLAHAQLLCESKLAEIVSGITPAEAVDKTPFDETMTESVDPDDTQWVFSIETEETDETGLISVRVTVTRDVSEDQHPVQFSLVRWLPDPNATPASQSGSSTTGASSPGT